MGDSFKINRRACIAGAGAAAAVAGNATAQPGDFNAYVLKAVTLLASERARGGYDLNSAFSRDLVYHGQVIRAVPAGKQPATKTMCVAAMAEVIVEAINRYVVETSDRTPYSQLAPQHWQTSRITSLRAYIFMQQDTRNVFGRTIGSVPRAKNDLGVWVPALSRGTAHALSIFRMGDELPFSQMKPGDFINLNRDGGPGHAVVFLSYIDKNNRYSNAYAPDCLGFQYFSAQGKGKPDAGFAYRDAYFGDGPATTVRWPKDRKVIRSSNQLLLNCGRLRVPARWDVTGALNDIQAKVRNSFPAGPTRSTRAAEELSRDVLPSLLQFTDEET